MCTKGVHLGLSNKLAFIEGCPHIRGGLYEGLHCNPFWGPGWDFIISM